MPSYSFHIRKADHVGPDGKPDLHVHVFYNEGNSRKLLGRYRLPTLAPVFSREPELNNAEMQALREWLAQPEQLRKLNNLAQETLFDLSKIARLTPTFSNVATGDDGDTYLTIRIPVSRRLRPDEHSRTS